MALICVYAVTSVEFEDKSIRMSFIKMIWNGCLCQVQSQQGNMRLIDTRESINIDDNSYKCHIISIPFR